MLDFIERRGLAGFIDGTVEAPPKRIPVSDVGHDYAISTEEVENDDYSSWERSEVYLGPVQLSSKKSMLDFTDLQGLAGFIDGTVEALTEGVPVSDIGDYSASSIEEVDNQDYRSWKRSDNLIWGWILIMLTKYILQQVLRFRTAKVVWTMLEKMFHVAKAFSQLAAISVPVGNNINGHPIFFFPNRAFVNFGISDVFALFSSVTSVLMFLSILTAHTMQSKIFSMPYPRD
ncbi:hypothetical protein HYC85_000373 [Camellia sinensis]|uniref:Uncharacterized protein n=1 Tax=Camellia sinensis TaxID=4442 RepID=A0A7J7I428_CAMSI|nr:hypothetical protein HYC85_000373 [Camellia sinensis]